MNLITGIYRLSGTRYYGKTATGQYMSEQDAVNAGCQAAGNEKVRPTSGKLAVHDRRIRNLPHNFGGGGFSLPHHRGIRRGESSLSIAVLDEVRPAKVRNSGSLVTIIIIRL